MGYRVKVHVCSIVINKENVEAALKAINDLMSTGKQFAWVTGPENKDEGYKNLHEAVQDWRFDCGYDLGGNFGIKRFTGENLGDDAALFEVIAPYVVSQYRANIVYSGEDGDKWRYAFSDGKVTREDAVFASDIKQKERAADAATERLIKAQQNTIKAAVQRLNLIASIAKDAKGRSTATMHQAIETIATIATDLDKEIEIMPTQMVGAIKPIGAPVATIDKIKD